MDLLEGLKVEHAVILSVVDALEAFAIRLERGATVDDHEVLRFVVFISDFADGLHHDKEEDVLLAAMARNGFAADSGVLMHVRDQHLRERDLFRRLKRAAVAPESATRAAELAAAARELIDFERAHIAKENEVLYPAAERHLSSEPSEELKRDMDRFTRMQISGHLAWLLDLGEQLVHTHHLK